MFTLALALQIVTARVNKNRDTVHHMRGVGPCVGQPVGVKASRRQASSTVSKQGQCGLV
jgi:hypothetical protein